MADTPVSDKARLIHESLYGAAETTPAVAPETAADDAPADVTVNVEDESGFLGDTVDQVVDLARGANKGLSEFVNETADFAASSADGVASRLNIPALVFRTGADAENGLIEPVILSRDTAEAEGITSALSAEHLGRATAPEAETAAGQLATGVTQFVTGFVGVGKVTAAAKAVTAAGRFGKAALQGGITDFMFFDPQEDRATNFVETLAPSIKDEWYTFLSADEDDTDLEGRLKNAVEGLGLGIAAEGVFLGLRAAGRMARKLRAGDKAGAEEIGKEAAEKIEGSLTGTKKAAEDASPKATEGSPETPVQAAGDVADTTPKAPDEAPVATTPDVDVAMLREAASSDDVFKASPLTNKKGNIFNWTKVHGPDGAKELIRKTAEALEPSMNEMFGTGKVTFEAMEKASIQDTADLLGMGATAYRTSLREAGLGTTEGLKKIVAGKKVMLSLARDITALAARIDDELVPTSAKEEGELLQMIQTLADVEQSVKSIQTSAARITAAGRIQITDDIDPKMLLRAIQEAGGSDNIKVMARRIQANKDNPKGVLRTIRKPTLLNKLSSYHVFSLLSGMSTHEINLLSNTLETLRLPLENLAGSAVRGDLNGMGRSTRHALYVMEAAWGAAKVFRQAMHVTGGEMSTSLKDASGVAGTARGVLKGVKNTRENLATGKPDNAGSAALRSLVGNDNVLDPGNTKLDFDTRQAFHSDAGGVGGNLVNAFGFTVDIPTRLLVTGDELFKQINYRAALKSRLVMEAKAKYPGDKLSQSQWVHEKFEAGFDDAGRGLDEEALAFSREATFTTDLKDIPTHSGKPSLSASVQKFASEHPSFRLLMPFIRTPSNLMRNVWTRTPGLNLFQKEWMDNYKAGGFRRSRAVGQMTSGLTMYGAAMMLAVEGRITGSAPTDPGERERFFASGQQEYSYVLKGDDGSTRYVQFGRMDPVGTFFGLAADMVGPGSAVAQEEWDEVLLAAGMALTNNLTSKSYTTGFSDALQAVGDPDRFLPAWASRFFSGFVPNALGDAAALAGQHDPLMREARDVGDAMLRKVPGYSETLPPKRDWVTGEVAKHPETLMLPNSLGAIRTGERSKHPALTELVALDHGFTRPSGTFGSLDIRDELPEAYDRYLELHGTVRSPTFGGTLIEALDGYVQSPAYNRDREAALLNDGGGSMVRRIIGHYRALAKEILMQEFPELRRAEVQGKVDNAKAQAGNPTAIEKLLNQ